MPTRVPQLLLTFSLMLVFVVTSAPAGGKALSSIAYRHTLTNLIRDKKRSPDSKLKQLMAANWAFGLAAEPSSATYLGFKQYDDRWADLSATSFKARRNARHATLKALTAIPVKRLSVENQLNWRLLQRQLIHAIKGEAFPNKWLQLSQMDGPQRNIPATFRAMPHRRKADFKNMLKRLEALPRYLSQVQFLLHQGLKNGVTPPQITLADVPRQIRALLTDDPWASPLLAGFVKIPATIAANKQRALRAAAAKVYRQQVVPAWQRLLTFIQKDYIPGARTFIAFGQLPQGKAWYRWKVEGYTTTHMTPEQIHQLGLREVKRLHAEMLKVIATTKFKGTFAKFLQFMRTDPQFFYTDKRDLMRGYRDIAKRIDAGLPTLFRVLPSLPYGVKEIPANEAKAQTTAYYSGGSMRAGRSGTFYANTYALNTRPKWEMTALALHEAVPGHHLQISLAQELKNLPDFRRYGGPTAFVEGWALYAEKLGYPLGVYDTAYDRFGQLTYEMWRAVRLVVDTGMHQLGWSRQQAIDYFKVNTSKTEHDITVEVDRYLVWPGQALAYKIGQLTISRLRAKAEKQLGNNFDVREFHQKILENGALPLDVLEEYIDQWLNSRRKDQKNLRKKVH